MAKPWGGGGGVGSWAAEAERAEAEEREMGPTTKTTSFPSLKESINSKPKKKKMSLSEFNTSVVVVNNNNTRLTPDEMLKLPTGPQPRADGDSSSHVGSRGFVSYGGRSEDRRGPREFEVRVSRADEVDNWGAGKKSFNRDDSGSGTGLSKYGSLGGGGGGGGGSRADEVGDWNVGKKLGGQSVNVRSNSNTFGSGFRDSGSDWRREREKEGGEMGRTRLVFDPPKVGGNEVVVKTNRTNPFGAARPREQVLEEKGLDWKKLDLDLEVKKASSSGSRPSSSHGSRPTSSQSNRSENVGFGAHGVGSEVVVKPRLKVNPFGDAKPREVLLEEKGLDWKKIDLELEHRRIDRPETEEEKASKEEIESLKKKLEKGSGDGDGVAQEYDAEQTSIHDLIQVKEKELEALIRDLDDKVRFGTKAVERPGSGAGRRATLPERPPSQSGSIDGARGSEFMDRPRSRGTGDVWTRPGEDRRGGGGFQGNRDGGFLNNRDFDRSRSRDRW